MVIRSVLRQRSLASGFQESGAKDGAGATGPTNSNFVAFLSVGKSQKTAANGTEKSGDIIARDDEQRKPLNRYGPIEMGQASPVFE